MPKWRYQQILWVFVIIATLAAVVISAKREHLEEANRTVSVAVDFNQVEKLAQWSNLSNLETLKYLKQQGVNAVLFKEQTIENLPPEVWVCSGAELLDKFPESIKAEVRPDSIYFVTRDHQIARQLELQLDNKVPGGVEVVNGSDLLALGVPLSTSELKDLGLGFSVQDMKMVQQLGMYIIPQVRWWYGANPVSLEETLQPLRDYQGHILALLFNDKLLPGFNYIDSLKEQIEQLGVPLGIIEFFPQEGLDKLVILLDKKAIRVHSMSENEMNNMAFSKAIDRFELAVKERNMRILIVRFNFSPGTTDWLKNNLNYINELTRTLENKGFIIGQAKPFPSYPFSRLWLFICGLGVIAAGILLMDKFGFFWLGMVMGLVGLIAWTGSLGLGYNMILARKVMALGASIIFPTLALLTAWRPTGRSLWSSIMILLRTTLISFMGAIIIASILTDNTFILKINEFSGVKLAFIAPLALFTGAVLIFKEKQRISAILKRGLNTSISVKFALLVLVTVIAGVIYLNRSGNEGIGLLPLEGQIRSFLGDVLIVRPRTKEFLLGYPFLLLSLTLGYQHRYLLLWLLGLIGQISLINTFCHIHIPLYISLLRIFNGLWLGLLIGIVMVLLVRLSRRFLRGTMIWPG
ncbi:MAG: hypothetical protein PWP31_445 [Clostridia bacterium]|nr:hypothetical protein [Clostridia bacterium]